MMKKRYLIALPALAALLTMGLSACVTDDPLVVLDPTPSTFSPTATPTPSTTSPGFEPLDVTFELPSGWQSHTLGELTYAVPVTWRPNNTLATASPNPNIDTSGSANWQGDLLVKPDPNSTVQLGAVETLNVIVFPREGEPFIDQKPTAGYTTYSFNVPGSQVSYATCQTLQFNNEAGGTAPAYWQCNIYVSSGTADYVLDLTTQANNFDMLKQLVGSLSIAPGNDDNHSKPQ